jgi:hypothetical protein
VRSLLIPDIALAAAALTLFYALLFFDAPAALFRDSDTGWHILTGERILAGNGWPHTDSYSWSRPGAPWFAWEWGADVVMAGAFRVAGMSGVTLLYLAAISVCTWLWFKLTWALNGGFLLACALASPMLSTVNMHWLARPHVFGWVCLLVWLLWASRVSGTIGGRGAVGVALLTVVWANLHASFFLLPVTAVLFALEKPAWFAPAALISAVASLLNPYGWNLHRHLFDYLTNRELLSHVGEFQSFNFHSTGAIQIVMTVVVAAAGAAYALEQRRVSHALLLGMFLFVALRSARGLPVLALLLPFANAAITSAMDRSAERLKAVVAYGRNLRALEVGFRGYAWAPLLLGLAFVILRAPAVQARTGFPAAEFPVDGAKAVAALPEQARLFAPDKFGGYLIYRFHGGRKVFFDGRSDFYGVAFMQKYLDLVQVRPGWVEEWNRWQFTHALLPVRYSLVDALPRLGWRETYRDKTAVLLEAPAALNSTNPVR